MGGVGGQQSVVYVDQQDRNALIISPEIQTWIKDRLSETDFLDKRLIYFDVPSSSCLLCAIQSVLQLDNLAFKEFGNAFFERK